MANQNGRRNRILISVIINSQNLLEMLMRIIAKSESAEDDFEFENEIFLMENVQRIRGKLRKPARITGYVDNVIPRYTTRQFRHHFRMVPEVFENLENRLGQSLSNAEPVGRPMIPVRIQLLSTIWLLSTPDSFRYITFFE